MHLHRIGVRSIEVVAAITAAVASAPVVLLAIAASVWHYRTQPFFVHDRVGLDGRVFRIIKVRTLPPDTDRYADKYALRTAKIPRSMKLVRKFHIDELPQLLHVVTGSMAFVGPRPEMPVLHEQLARDFAEERTSVRPGLTCLWQISRHNAGLIGERPEYDRLYVRQRNTRLDLWILARTVEKMVLGKMAHLHDVPKWAVDDSESEPSSTKTVAPRRAAPVTGDQFATVVD